MQVEIRGEFDRAAFHQAQPAGSQREAILEVNALKTFTGDSFPKVTVCAARSNFIELCERLVAFRELYDICNGL